MNRSSKLPIEIARFIGYSALIADEIGESPASVFSFDRGSERFFLKTSAATFAPTTYSVLREARVLQWLDGRLDVPEVVVVADNDMRLVDAIDAIPGLDAAAPGAGAETRVAGEPSRRG